MDSVSTGELDGVFFPRLVLDLDLGLTIVLLGIEAPLVTPITISHKSRHLPETHKAILPEITPLLIYIEIHGAGP